jgi:hypothetical protein
MRLPLLLVLAAVAVIPPLARAQEAKLFVTQTDIPQLRRLAPKLGAASIQGKQAVRTLAVSEKVKLDEVKQRLSNVTVAYTAVRLEEWIAELESGGADKDPTSPYGMHLAQARKQLEELTAPYRVAKAADGRTALDVNKTYVRQNLPQVTELVDSLKQVRPEALN